MEYALDNFSKLPSPSELRKRLQSLAMLDAIIMPDWDMRFFSYNSRWGAGEAMASMRDGEGSEFFFLFNDAGVAAKIYCAGYEIDSSISSALNEIPSCFSSFLEEAAFSINTATCYLWRCRSDDKWSATPRGIVEIPLLAFVSDEGEYYHAWAENYYEKAFDERCLHAVFEHEPLTSKIALTLNPEAEMETVLADADEIGFSTERNSSNS
jgi:hypothetical protein